MGFRSSHQVWRVKRFCMVSYKFRTDEAVPQGLPVHGRALMLELKPVCRQAGSDPLSGVAEF
jgi:hypothetical protein